MDAIPLFSQFKSVVQLVSGDTEGAAKTQENFFKRCPVLSQATAGVAYLAGDKKVAKEFWNEGTSTLNSMANGIPVVGHVKGGIHYLVGDEKGGAEAMKAATRTTAVAGAGVGGFLVAGPIGAAACGVEAGLVYDVAITTATGKDYGVVAAGEKIIKNPTDAGNYVDLVGGVAMDALTGYQAGQVIGTKIENALQGNNKAGQVQAKAPAQEAKGSGPQVADGPKANGGTPPDASKTGGGAPADGPKYSGGSSEGGMRGPEGQGGQVQITKSQGGSQVMVEIPESIESVRAKIAAPEQIPADQSRMTFRAEDLKPAQSKPSPFVDGKASMKLNLRSKPQPHQTSVSKSQSATPNMKTSSGPGSTGVILDPLADKHPRQEQEDRSTKGRAAQGTATAGGATSGTSNGQANQQTKQTGQGRQTNSSTPNSGAQKSGNGPPGQGNQQQPPASSQRINPLVEFEQLTGYDRTNWGDLSMLSGRERRQLENRVRNLVMTSRQFQNDRHILEQAVQWTQQQIQTLPPRGVANVLNFASYFEAFLALVRREQAAMNTQVQAELQQWQRSHLAHHCRMPTPQEVQNQTNSLQQRFITVSLGTFHAAMEQIRRNPRLVTGGVIGGNVQQWCAFRTGSIGFEVAVDLVYHWLKHAPPGMTLEEYVEDANRELDHAIQNGAVPDRDGLFVDTADLRLVVSIRNGVAYITTFFRKGH